MAACMHALAGRTGRNVGRAAQEYVVARVNQFTRLYSLLLLGADLSEPRDHSAVTEAMVADCIRASWDDLAAQATTSACSTLTTQTQSHLHASASGMSTGGTGTATPPSAPHPIQLQFCHDCRHGGCRDVHCVLCTNNPHKSCKEDGLDESFAGALYARLGER